MMIWVITGTYPTRMVALSALESTDKVTITQDRLIVFTPDEDTSTGLIFYPGGLVEPTAYAPILHMIAEEGVLVVITPMPLNLAILNTGAASVVIDDYPHISTWILAGHSLGGASAAIFAENNPTRIDALALWDSYPANSADLSDNTIPVISIFGTTNNFPNTDNFNDKKLLLPANTIFVGKGGRYNSVDYLKAVDPELYEIVSPYAHIGRSPNQRVHLILGERDTNVSSEIHADFNLLLLGAGYDSHLTLWDGTHRVPEELTADIVIDIVGK